VSGGEDTRRLSGPPHHHELRRSSAQASGPQIRPDYIQHVASSPAFHNPRYDVDAQHYPLKRARLGPRIPYRAEHYSNLQYPLGIRCTHRTMAPRGPCRVISRLRTRGIRVRRPKDQRSSWDRWTSCGLRRIGRLNTVRSECAIVGQSTRKKSFKHIMSCKASPARIWLRFLLLFSLNLHDNVQELTTHHFNSDSTPFSDDQYDPWIISAEDFAFGSRLG